MSRKFLATTILLSCPLSAIPVDTVHVLGRGLLTESIAEKKTDIQIHSRAPFKVGKETYTLDLELWSGEQSVYLAGHELPSSEKVFYLIGRVNLLDSRGHGVPNGEYDFDGSVVFEVYSEDDHEIKYKGYNCISSLTTCKAPGGLDLVYKKETGVWIFNIKPEEQMFIIDVPQNIEMVASSGSQN